MAFAAVATEVAVVAVVAARIVSVPAVVVVTIPTVMVPAMMVHTRLIVVKGAGLGQPCEQKCQCEHGRTEALKYFHDSPTE